MTAQFGVGRTRNGQIINDEDDRNQKSRITSGPEELDEGWWAAVLADEPVAQDHLDLDDSSIDVEILMPINGSTSCKVNWDTINNLLMNDEIIVAKVVSFNRGGVLVEADDIQGFVPASHLIDLPVKINEEEREHYFRSYLEREISLKVIECDRNKERAVFSERAALAGAGMRKNLLNSLAEGDVVSGVVTNVTDFGVFVDLGGLEGLIHISELSWGRVHHPTQILKLGDEVETMVIEVLETQGRVALSLKQLDKNPWENFVKYITPGDVLDAKISSIVRYGAFARLEVGVEGLIHISTINFPPDHIRIEDYLFVGQAVKVGVVSIDAQKRRLGLRLESL